MTETGKVPLDKTPVDRPRAPAPPPPATPAPAAAASVSASTAVRLSKDAPPEPSTTTARDDVEAVPGSPVLATPVADAPVEDAPVENTPVEGEPLVQALQGLRDQLDQLRLPLLVPGVEHARTDRGTLLDQLDDYLLPRLRQLDAPLLAVVGGSTGAGKSTLVNSVLRQHLTRAGALRPTTRSPVLVHHPNDAHWFTTPRVLPSLARISGADPEPSPQETATTIGAVRLMPCAALPEGFALLDAPDIDSVVDANRELAAQLLAAGDLWLFVTTAARYADAVPWDMLRTAVERGTSIAVVLDRVPPDALQEVRTDLAGMLVRNNLPDAPLFTIAEVPLENGLLPSGVVAHVRLWFMDLASSQAARQEVVKRTLGGALDSLRHRVPALAGAADEQSDAEAGLRAEVATAYAEADKQLEKGLTDGTLLRGEVLARWQEFVGTGEVLRSLESAVGRVRDRLVAAVTGKPAPAEPLGQALQSGVAALVSAQAADASERAVLRWRASPAGSALIGPRPEQIARLSTDFDDRLERMVRDWQGHVLDLVRAQAGSKRSQARYLSLGVNALGITLMIIVFASTAAIPTGAEVGVGAGTAVVGQKLLEAIFGDQAVRQLASEARRDLMARVESLLDGERDRLIDLLREAGVDPQAGARLRAASVEVQEAR